MSEQQYLSPTPIKRPGFSLLARGLAGVNDFVSAEDKAVPGKKANALLSGLANLVGLPEAQALMEKLAYGERLTTGKGQTLKPAENVVEGALALSPLASGMARGAAKVAGKIPLQRDSSPNAIVWHGSPKEFTQFDPNAIGSTTGMAAHGHGFNLAQNPNTAKAYQSAGANVYIDKKTGKLVPFEEIPKDLLHAEPLRFTRSKGNLYKIDLPDDLIARFLQQDLPISQQPPSVQKGLAQSPSVANYMERAEAQRKLLNERSPIRLEKIPSASKPFDETRMLGKEAYTAIAQEYGSGRGTVERLQELGIPGLQYRDPTFQDAPNFFNFTVFPDSAELLQILERNGIPLGKGLVGK